MVKKPRGPRTVYAPKIPPCETCLLTGLAKRILAAAAERTGAGKSNVVEHLLRKHGGEVTARDFEHLTEEIVNGAEEAAEPQRQRAKRVRRADAGSAAVA